MTTGGPPWSWRRASTTRRLKSSRSSRTTLLGGLAVEQRVELGVVLAQLQRGREHAGDLLALDQLLQPPVPVVRRAEVTRAACPPRAGCRTRRAPSPAGSAGRPSASGAGSGLRPRRQPVRLSRATCGRSGSGVPSRPVLALGHQAHPRTTLADDFHATDGSSAVREVHRWRSLRPVWGMGESPRWHDGRLWVCDWVAGEVLSFDETGERRVELTMKGLPFSVDWLPDGRTVLTSAEGVVTADEDGTLTPYGGDRAGLERDRRRPSRQHVRQRDRLRPHGRRGADARVSSGSSVRTGRREQVADDVWFPNGMAVTDDGSTLVVAESYGHCLTGFDIARRRLARRTGGSGPTSARPAPDGICLDAEGAVWYADVPTAAASASPRAARCSRSSRPTGAASPACSAARTAARSTWSRQEWGGTEGVGAAPGRCSPPCGGAAGRP